MEMNADPLQLSPLGSLARPSGHVLVDPRIELKVQAMPGKGRGVVTLSPIKKGAVILCDPVERYSGVEARQLRSHAIYYHLFVDPRTYGTARPVDVLWAIGAISVVNHADRPNCRVAWERDEAGEWAVLSAERDIVAGAELLVRYTNIEEYADHASFL